MTFILSSLSSSHQICLKPCFVKEAFDQETPYSSKMGCGIFISMSKAAQKGYTYITIDYVFVTDYIRALGAHFKRNLCAFFKG